MTRLVLTGTTPLLCHNSQLADPDNEWSKQIAVLTKKRTKTEDDRLAISKLEWYGGIYTAPGITGPAYPTANLRKCLIQAGKISKLGKAVERAVIFTGGMYVSLDCGPERDVKKLAALPEFNNRASVKVGMQRVMRTRPSFPTWSITADVTVITDVLDLDDFKRIVAVAGQVEGLGDNRVNGYGRFTATVK